MSITPDLLASCAERPRVLLVSSVSRAAFVSPSPPAPAWKPKRLRTQRSNGSPVCGPIMQTGSRGGKPLREPVCMEVVEPFRRRLDRPGVDAASSNWRRHGCVLGGDGPARARNSRPLALPPLGAHHGHRRPRPIERARPAAELTNRVLSGEVWPGAGLSQRDRSIITVSALSAMNRPNRGIHTPSRFVFALRLATRQGERTASTSRSA